MEKTFFFWWWGYHLPIISNSGGGILKIQLKACATGYQTRDPRNHWTLLSFAAASIRRHG
jgi:hypothetical protein